MVEPNIKDDDLIFLENMILESNISLTHDFMRRISYNMFNATFKTTYIYGLSCVFEELSVSLKNDDDVVNICHEKLLEVFTIPFINVYGNVSCNVENAIRYAFQNIITKYENCDKYWNEVSRDVILMFSEDFSRIFVESVRDEYIDKVCRLMFGGFFAKS